MRAPPGTRRTSDVPWTARLRLGFAYVRERPVLKRLLAAESIAFIFFALVLPIEVAFAKETLDAGDLGYGLLLASWGMRDGRGQPALLNAARSVARRRS